MASFDFGKLLDDAIKSYETVSVARANRDTVKYQSAGAQQASALHSPEAFSGLESYNTGNAANPAGVPYVDRIPKGLLLGSVFLLGGALLLRRGRR